MFTTTEINTAKELAYENWRNEDTEIGFEYNGQWITNPFVDESGRLEFVNYEVMCEHYGRESVEWFIKKILGNGGEMEEDDLMFGYDDDSDRGCSDCPDDECTGHCMSCYYRPI